MFDQTDIFGEVAWLIKSSTRLEILWYLNANNKSLRSYLNDHVQLAYLLQGSVLGWRRSRFGKSNPKGPSNSESLILQLTWSLAVSVYMESILLFMLDCVCVYTQSLSQDYSLLKRFSIEMDWLENRV